jgi:membrane protein YqaA with SNARE-associated domain
MVISAVTEAKLMGNISNYWFGYGGKESVEIVLYNHSNHNNSI